MLIDTDIHMTLKDIALELGLSYATLYNYRRDGVLTFPEPYCEVWNVTLYDVNVIAEWYQHVPPPGAPGPRRRAAKNTVPSVEPYVDEDGREHVSQQEIATRTGVSRQNISLWTTKPGFPEVSYVQGAAKLRPWDEVQSWVEVYREGKTR